MNDFSTKKREGFLGQKLIFIPKTIRDNIQDNPLVNSLYITSIGYYPHAAHHFRKREEGSNQFILIYCVEGGGNIEMNNQKFRLTPNHFFIIPSHISHCYKADKKDPWSIYWLHFTGSSAKLLYDRYNRSKKSNTVHIPFQESRIDFFEHIIDILETGYSKNNIEYINITLWELLSSFIYCDYFQKIGHQANGAKFINEAINYMQESIDQSITVDDIAQQVNYSVSYFHSIFKDKTGFSPIHYFNQLKVQKACQYLSFTNLNIKEIGYKLGFNDPFYFSRLFKKMMRLSPTMYRKMYRTDLNSKKKTR